MAITSQDSKAGPYEGNGVQTEFPFGFRVLDASHVAVYINDVIVESGFSVSLSAIGGTVVFTTAPPVGAILAIVRNVPVTQEVDLQNNTAFLPEVIETALDRLTMICQQLKETFGRTLTLPPTKEFDQDTLYDAFVDLVANAETWAEEASAGAARASTYATDAGNKASIAVAAANDVTSSVSKAVAAAGRAEVSAGNASESYTEIKSIYDQSELNRVTLAYGDWGADGGALITYDDWTNASDLPTAAKGLLDHESDVSAHGGATEVISDLFRKGVYPHAIGWCSGNLDNVSGVNDQGVYVYNAQVTDNGPEKTGFALVCISGYGGYTYMTWQNFQTGNLFWRSGLSGVWNPWKRVTSSEEDPAGIVKAFAGTGAIPPGYLLCDGAEKYRSEYARLFTAIGTTYGKGDGSSTFNLPDFRGVFLRGAGSAHSAAMGEMQPEGLPNITGSNTGVGGQGTFTGAFATSDSVVKPRYATQSYNGSSLSFNASLSNPIYGASDHVTPMNYAVQYIIKY